MAYTRRNPLVVYACGRSCRFRLTALALLLGASACAPKSSPYDRLCKIYEEYAREPSTAELAVKISERVQGEIPEIYSNYDVIMVSSVNQRYAALREFARETAQQPDWSCEAIRKRFPPAGSR